ncbi:hypothetical protein [Blastococcus saxobsidens]|uniref:Uncharacterized protein n=1 Tax=Blastococcus saxobsidens TaxID=138336 RepID=A0A4Q7YAX7_9ACTN|nr:hypothetical protein [Blastococcus saxobsidens]RZU33724.1 hypothetical protein BKA19_3459 [Blastococcus saxobsidens]
MTVARPDRTPSAGRTGIPLFRRLGDARVAADLRTTVGRFTY